ncbi:MAG: hypothetical protein HY721_19080 [Planctomycetes bacterium]|nr:hypothetical protein [Planctomycetota bacterium]
MRRTLCISLLAAAAGSFSAGCKSSIRPARARAVTLEPAEPLLAVSVSPLPGRREVGPLTEIRVGFSAALDPGSLGSDPIVVTSLRSFQVLPGASALEGEATVLVFRAQGGMKPDSMYEVRLSRALRSEQGALLEVSPGPSRPSFPVYYATFAIAPVLQGDVRASAESTSALRLDWDDAADNATPASQIVYEVFAAEAEVPLDLDKPPQRLTAPGVTEEVVVRLRPATEYRLAIRARDDLGNRSAPSAVLTARTLDAEDRDPPAFAGVAAVDADPRFPHELRASWAPAADATPAQDLRYNAYVSLEPGRQDFSTPAKTSEPGALSMAIGGLPPDTTHFVVVRAVDTAGNEDSNAVEVSARTAASFAESVFPVITLPPGTDMGLCWPAGARPRTGGCARSTCHMGDRPAGGVSFTTYDAFFRPGRSGLRPVVAENPAASTLLVRTRRQPGQSGFMPRGGSAPLHDECLDAIERWILQGALDN